MKNGIFGTCNNLICCYVHHLDLTTRYTRLKHYDTPTRLPYIYRPKPPNTLPAASRIASMELFSSSSSLVVSSNGLSRLFLLNLGSFIGPGHGSFFQLISGTLNIIARPDLGPLSCYCDIRYVQPLGNFSHLLPTSDRKPGEKSSVRVYPFSTHIPTGRHTRHFGAM